MDIVHLSYFLEVAHHKSFTKASQSLHISQPSISKGIRTLEEEWGQKLFYRHGHSVELTEAGHTLLPQIKSIVCQFQQLEQQMTEDQDFQRGSLSIGIPPMIGSSFLSPLIRDFLRRYPHIELKLTEDGSNKIAEAVRNGSLQVGFVALPVADNDMESYIFNNEPLQIVLPPDHLLANRSKLSLLDIKDEPFVFFTKTFSLYSIVTDQFQKIGIRPHIVSQSDNWDFIAEMVRVRLGIALLPKRICQRLDRKDFVIIDLKPDIPWILSMIWNEKGYISTPTRLWTSYFKNRVTEVSNVN